jgi:hypothetical protein
MFDSRPIRVHPVKKDRDRKNQNQRGGRGGYPPRQDGRGYNAGGSQGSGYGDKQYNDRSPRSYDQQGGRSYNQSASFDRNDRGSSGPRSAAGGNRYQGAPAAGGRPGYQSNGDNRVGNNYGSAGYGGNRNYGGQGSGYRDEQGGYGGQGPRNQRGAPVSARGNYRQTGGAPLAKAEPPTEDYNPEDENSSERPRIKLLPRTVAAPVCDLAPISSRDKIFGEAKPRDEVKADTDRKRQESESAKSTTSSTN